MARERVSFEADGPTPGRGVIEKKERGGKGGARAQPQKEHEISSNERRWSFLTVKRGTLRGKKGERTGGPSDTAGGTALLLREKRGAARHYPGEKKRMGKKGGVGKFAPKKTAAFSSESRSPENGEPNVVRDRNPRLPPGKKKETNKKVAVSTKEKRLHHLKGHRHLKKGHKKKEKRGKRGGGILARLGKTTASPGTKTTTGIRTRGKGELPLRAYSTRGELR